MKQTEPVERLVVKELVIADSQGRQRIWLRTDSVTDTPVVELLDDKQQQRVSIGLDRQQEPHISLLDERGGTAIGMGTSANGDVALYVFDRQGQVVVVLGIPHEGDRQIALYDANLQCIWRT